MPRLSIRQRPQWSFMGLVAIVCVALVLITGFAQVAHSHPTGQPEHGDCSLCVAAHHVVQVVALVSLELATQHVAPVPVEPPSDLPQHKLPAKLANRPPPAQPSFA